MFRFHHGVVPELKFDWKMNDVTFSQALHTANDEYAGHVQLPVAQVGEYAGLPRSAVLSIPSQTARFTEFAKTTPSEKST